jgi:hypothetical protein
MFVTYVGHRARVTHLLLSAGRCSEGLPRERVAGVVDPEVAAVTRHHVIIRVKPHLRADQKIY